MTVNLPADTNAGSWYIGNIKHSGWYRVNYDQANWALLIAQLNANRTLLHPIHRAQLLDDSFNLGRAEVVPQTLFLDITTYLKAETDPLAFVPAFTGLNWITNYVEDDLDIARRYKVHFQFFLQFNNDYI